MRQPTGFTLVEVMVVMVIIGVLVSTVSLAMGALQQRERNMALQQVRRVLEASIERAMVRGVTLAAEFDSAGYRFVHRDVDNRWVPLIDPPLFADRRLPPGWTWDTLRTSAGERPVGEGTRLVFALEPQPFRLSISVDGVTHQWVADGSGTVSLDP